MIAQGAWQRAYVAEKTRKNFPFLFLIRRDRARCTAKSIRSQGRQQSETETKGSNNKLIKYERFKQIRHFNIIPSNLPKWVFLNQTETVFGETKIFPNGNGTSDAMD